VGGKNDGTACLTHESAQALLDELANLNPYDLAATKGVGRSVDANQLGAEVLGPAHQVSMQGRSLPDSIFGEVHQNVFHVFPGHQLQVPQIFHVAAVHFVDGFLPSPKFFVAILTEKADRLTRLGLEAKPRHPDRAGSQQLLQEQRFSNPAIAVQRRYDCFQEPVLDAPTAFRSRPALPLCRPDYPQLRLPFRLRLSGPAEHAHDVEPALWRRIRQIPALGQVRRQVDDAHARRDALQGGADGFRGLAAGFVGIGPDRHLAALEVAPVGAVDGVAATLPRHRDVLGQQLGRGVGGLLAFDDEHRGIQPLG